MSDPKRWRETEGEKVVVLLNELAKVEPTPAVRESVWDRIATTLPPDPGSSSPTGSGVKAGATVGGKVIAAAIATALVGAAAISLLAPPAPKPESFTAATTTATVPFVPARPDPLSSSAAISPEVAPSAPVRASTVIPTNKPTARPHPSAQGERVPTTAAAPAATAAAPATTPTPADRLREEAEGVRKARQLLREKNASAAMVELDRLAKLVPNGPLEEEREVLTIESLMMTGSTDAARRRAARFLMERPQSVHAARVHAISGS